MYEVPCKDCESLYFGDTGIAMEKRLAEHKNVVKKYDTSNGTAVHSWANQHRVAAKSKSSRSKQLESRMLEALHIHQ